MEGTKKDLKIMLVNTQSTLDRLINHLKQHNDVPVDLYNSTVFFGHSERSNYLILEVIIKISDCLNEINEKLERGGR